MLAPPSHHRASALDVVRPVVGAANLVLVDVGKCYLNQFRVPAMLVENGARHRAHAVADQAPFEAHPFKRHIGSLAIAVSARVPVCGEHVLSVSAVRLDRLQKCEGLFRERDDMRPAFFHAFRRDRPDLLLDVDVHPAGGRSLGWPGHGVELPFDEAAGRSFDTGIGDRHHELLELVRGSAAMFFFFGFLKTERIPLSGFA